MLTLIFSTDVNYIASQASLVSAQQQNGGTAADGGADGEAEDAMKALERQARAPMGFVAASTGPEGSQIKMAQQAQKETTEATPAVAAENPDAIDLDEDL